MFLETWLEVQIQVLPGKHSHVLAGIYRTRDAGLNCSYPLCWNPVGWPFMILFLPEYRFQVSNKPSVKSLMTRTIDLFIVDCLCQRFSPKNLKFALWIIPQLPGWVERTLVLTSEDADFPEEVLIPADTVDGLGEVLKKYSFSWLHSRPWQSGSPVVGSPQQFMEEVLQEILMCSWAENLVLDCVLT